MSLIVSDPGDSSEGTRVETKTVDVFPLHFLVGFIFPTVSVIYTVISLLVKPTRLDLLVNLVRNLFNFKSNTIQVSFNSILIKINY